MMDIYEWLMFGVAFGTLILAVVMAIIDHWSGKSSKNKEEEEINNKEEEGKIIE